MKPTKILLTHMIDETITLLAAIERLTNAAYKILLSVDEAGKLTGVITDFDIRQAILNKHPLDANVADVINRNPICASEDTSDNDIFSLMIDNKCNQIPIVDRTAKPKDIRVYSELACNIKQKPVRVAVVMAGGFGSRLRPLTEVTPKPLLEISGRPMLFILLDQLISEGFNKIYITLFYKSEMVIDKVKSIARYNNIVEFLIEKEPLGTGGSLSLIPETPASPFLIINADLLTEVPFSEMLNFHLASQNTLTIALKRESFEIPYGVAELKNGCITSLKERPIMTMDVNAGVYIVSPHVLNHVETDTKLDMPTLVSKLLEKELRIGGFPIHEFWLDIGTHENFNKAKKNIEIFAAIIFSKFE